MSLSGILPALAAAAAVAAAQTPAAAGRFETHLIASGLRGGYQVAAADLSGDGKPDLIALGQGMRELVWYENPSWERRVLATGVSQMVNCVLMDSGEIVLASGFSNVARQSAGIISVLRRGEDVRQPWTATEIDRLPTSHRLRLAKIDDGPRVAVNAPLTGADAVAPDYRTSTPLVYYRPGDWKRQLISEELSGVMHGVLVLDWDGDGRDEILTASFGGIDLFRFGKDGATRARIASGDPSAWPQSGSSDLAVGTLGGKRFLASIEPWHGNQVAIWRETDGRWTRQVIEDKLNDGHALAAADFTGSGRSQVVAGFRGPGGSVFLYTPDASGTKWTRDTLDPALAAASCVTADLNGDGRTDVACIDATKLKWYQNRGAAN